MTGSGSRNQSARPSPPRRYGPEVGEPPPLVDPRRWGSVIGLVGGLLFVTSYSTVFGTAVAIALWSTGGALALAALFALYKRPVSLGPLVRLRPIALATYCGCVIGELALIAYGSHALVAAGHGDLRPALIAAVVGLHFIPLGWALDERMFFWLGGLLVVLGVVGLLAGATGIAHAANAVAVAAGLSLLVIITLYARGRFAPPLPTETASSS